MTARKAPAKAKAKAKSKAKATPVKAKGKTPVKYSPELAAAICRRIELGEYLGDICASAGMPSRNTIHQWVTHNHEGFHDIYMPARALGFDARAEEALRIANTPLEGVTTETDADGNITKQTRADMLGHRRLQVDTMKWILSKQAPHKYGDRTALDHTSSDGSMTPAALGDTERAARIAALLGLAKQRATGSADEPGDDDAG